MNKPKLNVEALVVTTFATVAAPQAVANRGAAVSAEITDCTCQPYFCINWPSGKI